MAWMTTQEYFYATYIASHRKRRLLTISRKVQGECHLEMTQESSRLGGGRVSWKKKNNIQPFCFLKQIVINIRGPTNLIFSGTNIHKAETSILTSLK